MVAMISGEIFPGRGLLTLNAGRSSRPVRVANTGNRSEQVGSHYHFADANTALDFDRYAALGMRLDIPAGTAVRLEPSQTPEVTLVSYDGRRHVYGFNVHIMGALKDAWQDQPK